MAVKMLLSFVLVFGAAADQQNGAFKIKAAIEAGTAQLRRLQSMSNACREACWEESKAIIDAGQALEGEGFLSSVCDAVEHLEQLKFLDCFQTTTECEADVVEYFESGFDSLVDMKTCICDVCPTLQCVRANFASEKSYCEAISGYMCVDEKYACRAYKDALGWDLSVFESMIPTCEAEGYSTTCNAKIINSAEKPSSKAVALVGAVALLTWHL